MMTQPLFSFWIDETGQDLIEYSLLLAFFMFVTVALIGFGGQSIKGIVSTSNSQLAAGNALVQGG